MNEDQIKTLCQYFSHGEVAFIGPYSGAFRPIVKIEGDWAHLNDDSKINLTICEPTDFYRAARTLIKIEERSAELLKEVKGK